MANMTGGEIHYLRRIKTGDYEHKEFASKISWSAADGDSETTCEALHERAAAHAVRIVHHHLGLVCPPPGEELIRGMENAVAHARNEPAPQQRLHEIVNGLPKKQKMVPAAEVKPEVISAIVEKISVPATGTEPEVVGGKVVSVSADPLLDEVAGLTQPAPATISVEDLTAAVHKKFGAGATPEDRAKFPAFKLGLPRFAPQISAIAEEKRHEFLTWLASL